LAALIARTIIFPVGALDEASYLVRFIVVLASLLIFYLTKRNLVYPTVFSVVFLSLLSSFYQ
jgi:branched-subunit amino acid transport protein